MAGRADRPILGGDQSELDEALEAIYCGDEIERTEWEAPTDGRSHGAVKGRTFPRVAKWLDQIRSFFPKDVVVLLQKDAIERRGLKELLFEPEILASVEPSLDLAATVLAMKNMVPEKAKSAARDLVRRVVEDVRKRLESQFTQAIRGALQRNRPQPVSQPAEPRLAAHHPAEHQELQQRIADDHPGADLFFRPAPASEPMEHHHRHGSVRFDGDVAHLRAASWAPSWPALVPWKHTSSRSITKTSWT